MKADYTDTYTTTVRNARCMTAPDLFRLMFVRYPKPVQYLLRLRDWLVKPFGLQARGGFTDLIQEQNEENVVFGKQDKHLAFEVRLTCPPTRHIQTMPSHTDNNLRPVSQHTGQSLFLLHPPLPLPDLQKPFETGSTKLGKGCSQRTNQTRKQ